MPRKGLLATAPPPSDESEDRHFELVQKAEQEKKAEAAKKLADDERDRKLAKLRDRILREAELDRTQPQVELGQFVDGLPSKRARIIIGALTVAIVAILLL